MTNSKFVARCVAKDVPIWDLTVNGRDIGILTDLPEEASPIATVRYEDLTETVAARTISATLVKAREAYEAMEAATAAQYYQDCEEEYIEDEDGSEAFVRMMENRSEVWAMSDPEYYFAH